MLLEDAKETDGGQYRCTARNEMGELSVTLHLQVEPPLVVGRKTDKTLNYPFFHVEIAV